MTAADASAKCGARTRSGGQCTLGAGWGTDHVGVGNCKLHGGSTPAGRRFAARKIAVSLAEELEVEPHDALLWMVRAAAGEVAFLTERVRELQQQQLLVEQERVREWVGNGENGTGGGIETIRSTDARLHAWVAARQDAMDRLARFAKIAVDAGVQERQVRLAEQHAARIAAAFGLLLDHFGLRDHPDAPEVVRRALLELETGG